MYISPRQRELIVLSQRAHANGIKLGKRSVHWVSYTTPDGSVCREYYMTPSEAQRRANELVKGMNRGKNERS